MNAVNYLSGSKLDDQPVRVEIDRGHLEQEPDRKFGRSRSGGQVRSLRIEPSVDAAKLW